MKTPVSKEVARQMFEDAPPGSPELDEAVEAWAAALVRELFASEEDE